MGRKVCVPKSCRGSINRARKALVTRKRAAPLMETERRAARRGTALADRDTSLDSFVPQGGVELPWLDQQGPPGGMTPRLRTAVGVLRSLSFLQ